jgi:hypothetical protein
MDMPHHRLARLTLWIMAALVAAAMAFAPTAAAAHPGHEHRHHATAIVSTNSPILMSDAATVDVGASSKATALSNSTAAQLVASSAGHDLDPHGVCGVACCSGSGCCSSACLTSPMRSIPAPSGIAARQTMPQGRAPDGVDPVALLRPPIPFA